MSASAVVDRLMARWSDTPAVLDRLIPVARAYLRYWPIRRGKPAVWSRLVEPYLAWQPHAFRARTRFGFRMEGNTSDLIQQWLYYFGVWEPALTAWIETRLRPGDTFVDVGANVGYYALLGAHVVGPPGRVVAVEASPDIADILRRNVQASRAENIRVVNAAAYGSRGVVRLYRGNAANCGETTIVTEFGGEAECEIDAFPLQDILTPEELESARLIKIDAEGAEYAILAGFDGFRRLRPDAELIVEVHPQYLAKRNESLEDLLALMAREGFTPYRVKEEYWAPGYLAGNPFPAPRRLQREVNDGTSLIFSRVDADVLT
jgi:FkbM family methyltransferase